MSTYHVLVSLRVLYTVNTSPQYILAKSTEKIAVGPIDEASSSSSSPRHGRTSVKACAMAICRSSPELTPDMTKDYSVYILDPLEDLISKSRHGQSGGVAVGMGLMSAVLGVEMKDSPSVTGTFVGSGGDDDALEVVISLRLVTRPPSSINNFAQNPNHMSAGTQSRRDPPRQFLAPAPAPMPSSSVGSSKSSSKPVKPNKPINPSHFTRAHLMPTPYIGPPKKGRNSKNGYSLSRQPSASYTPDYQKPAPVVQVKVESELEDVLSTGTPGSSQETCRNPPECLPKPSSNQPRQRTESTPSADVSQSAVIIAALSSVAAQQSGVGTVSQLAAVQPNPELVDFFKAYLHYVKAQKDAGITIPEPSDVVSSSSTIDVQQHTTLQTDPSQSSVGDKENVKPSPPVLSKPTEPQTATSPLGSSRYNSRLSSDGLTLAKSGGPSSGIPSSSSSSSVPTKRKHSDASSSVLDDPQKRGTLSSSSIQLTPANVDGSARPNNGWGGLRRMADGSIWNGHGSQSTTVLVAERTDNSPQPFVFRSTEAKKTTVDAPARKGPYVVPDWAKNCPPPAPPPRTEDPEESKVDKKVAKSKKTKSKGLERLGGKGTIKRDRIPSASKENVAEPKTPPRRASGPFTSVQDEMGFKTPRDRSRPTPSKLPIFAQSSPATRSPYATLFQAFHTSPIKPNASRSGMDLTPRRAVTSPSDAELGTSLFTPSPTKSTRSSTARSLFPADDTPPSPSPSKPPKNGSSSMLGSRSNTPATDAESQNGAYDPPSCLPIASSDDLTEESCRTDLSMSSEATIMNSKMHDWSSLELPPSSPPPPSSPALTPMNGSDFPPSDEPSDFSETSPSVYSDALTPMSHKEESQTPSSETECERKADAEDETIRLDNTATDYPDSDANALMTDFFSDVGFSEMDIPSIDNPAAVNAVDALRNGLFDENFSEAWSLLDNVLLPGSQEQTQCIDPNANLEIDFPDWLVGTNSAFDFNEFGAAPADGKQEDQANLAAVNFAELLQGYLV